jgi:sugar (pentulose or hexulose) kinase
MSLNTTSADLVMALCESIAFAARLCFEHMGLKGELSVTGGGIKSREWAKIIANVMNRPISIPNEELVGARGVARIAWQYLNNPVDETLWESQRITINNDPELSKFYDEKYLKYKEVLNVARNTWKSQ